MGLKVDVAYYNNQMPDHEVQIVNVEFPDTKIALGTEFDVNVAYKSTVAGKFTIKITDTNREGVQTVTEVRDVTLVAGNEEIISIKMAYELNGLHEFRDKKQLLCFFYKSRSIRQNSYTLQRS